MKWEYFLVFIAGLAIFGIYSVSAEANDTWRLNLSQVGINMDIPKGYTFYGNFSNESFEGHIANPSNLSVIKILTFYAEGDMEKLIEKVRSEEKALEGYSAVTSENTTISGRNAFIDTYNFKKNETELRSVQILIPKDELLYSFDFSDKMTDANASYAALNKSINSIELVDKQRWEDPYDYMYGGDDGIWYDGYGGEYWSWWCY